MFMFGYCSSLWLFISLFGILIRSTFQVIQSGHDTRGNVSTADTSILSLTSHINNDSVAFSLEATRNAFHELLQNLTRHELEGEIAKILKLVPRAHKTLVGMISVYREKDEYLYRTLSSVLPALFNSNITSSLQGSVVSTNKVNIFLGSPESDYAKFTRHNSLVNIIPMKEEFWNAPYASYTQSNRNPANFSPLKDHIVRVKKGENMIRMMEGLVEMALKEQNLTDFDNSLSSLTYGTLLLEDDIIMLSDSATRLDDTINAIEKVIGKDADYILSCYVNEFHKKTIGGDPSNYKDFNLMASIFNFTQLVTSPNQFSRLQLSSPKQFAFAQCLYMPAKTAKKVTVWLRSTYYTHSSTKNWIASDQQLGDFSLTFDIPILAMHEPIAQHIGKVTTGLCPYFQQGIGMIQIAM